MKIIQISDCHLFADTNKVGYNQINPYISLSEILMIVSAYKPDLLLITGDVSGDASASSYQHFRTLLAQSKITCPLSIIPGNHDEPTLLIESFPVEQLWLRPPLIDRDSNWQIHLLNSHHQGTLGSVTERDLQQLAKQFKNNPDKYHMVAVHHHPIPCNTWMDKHEWLNRHEFMDLVSQYSSVKAVVYGHIHADIAIHRQGVEYLACPSTCWQWGNASTFGLSEFKPGFRVINLAENGQVTTSVQRLVSA